MKNPIPLFAILLVGLLLVSFVRSGIGPNLPDGKTSYELSEFKQTALTSTLGSAASDPQAPLLLLKFGADWCGPCQALKPELAKVERSDLPIRVFQVDTDQAPELAAVFEVQGIPRMLLIENGRVVGDLTGYMDADQISEWVQLCASEETLALPKPPPADFVVKRNPFVGQ